MIPRLRRRALLAGALTLGAAPARAQSADPPWLAPLMARLAAIGERRATFEEERRIAALSRPLASHGVLVWRRPSYLEKTTLAPRPERLLVDGDQLTLAAGGEPPRVVALSSQPQLAALVDAIRAPLAGDLAGLRRIFTLVADGSEAAWRITLTPIEPAVAALVRVIQLDGAGTSIRRVETTQSNGDTQSLAITDQTAT